MSAKTPFGLIGVGGFGKPHLFALQRLEREGRIELAAVCDPAIDHLTEIAEELSTRKVRMYHSHREMLAREPRLKAISIAAPIPFHESIVRDCLEQDVFIYLEKPPVPLFSQLSDLIATDTRGRVAVGFQLIESRWSRLIKTWIVEGQLGEVQDIRVAACWPRTDHYYSRARWAGRMMLDGNPVFDGPATNALSHMIHSIMYFAAPNFESFAEPVTVQGELYRARPIESYDVACVKGQFDSGIQFHAAFAHATDKFYPFQIEVRGTEGWARVTEEGKVVTSHLGEFSCYQDDQDILDSSYDAFLGYLQGKRSRPSTLLRDTRGYSMTTIAMLESSGGIRSIDPSDVDRIGDGKDGIYSVRGLHEVIVDFMNRPALFSERNLPWATQSPVVSAKDLGRMKNFRQVAAGATG